jgi:hypothetical protein
VGQTAPLGGRHDRKVVHHGRESRAVILEATYPNEQELKQIVIGVLKGESGPLDDVITGVIFGENKPEVWGQWPPEAIRTWSLACQLYYDLLQDEEETEWARGSRNDLTLPTSWRAILAVCPDRKKWWQLPGVTWAKIGERIGIPSRLASYRMERLGWRLAGSGMHVPDRRVIEAPCVNCGQVWTPNDIRGRHGPCCLG